MTAQQINGLPVPETLGGRSDREVAAAAVDWIVDNKAGAWGGVLLQTEWMTDVVLVAIRAARDRLQSTPPAGRS